MVEDYVTTGEFDRRMTSLEARLDRGFDRVTERLDNDHDRIVQMETRAHHTARSTASGWSTGVSVVVVAVIETMKAYFGWR